jgi:hypothetical protein
MGMMRRELLGRWTMSLAAMASTLPALAADLAADSLKFAPGVVKAAG